MPEFKRREDAEAERNKSERLLITGALDLFGINIFLQPDIGAITSLMGNPSPSASVADGNALMLFVPIQAFWVADATVRFKTGTGLVERAELKVKAAGTIMHNFKESLAQAAKASVRKREQKDLR